MVALSTDTWLPLSEPERSVTYARDPSGVNATNLASLGKEPVIVLVTGKGAVALITLT